MAIPDTNGIFIHNGLNCTPPYVPTAQSIPMSPADSTSTKNAIDTALSNIANEYDTSTTYTLGDFVIYDKVLYKCIMHSTTGDGDSTRWVAVNSKDSGINLKNSSGNTLVKIWEDSLGRGTISLYDKTTGYDTVSLYGSGYVDAKSITVMTSGSSNSGRVELTTTQSNGGYIYLRDNNKNTPIELNADDGNINAISLNGVTIGSSPKFTDTTYESKTASSGGTDLSLVTTGEKYVWNNSQKPIAYINVIGDKTTDAWDTSPGSTYSIASITDAFGNNISYSTLWDTTHNMLYDVYFIYKYTPSSGQQNEYTYKWEATRYLYYINMNTIRIEWEWQDASNRYVMMTTDGSTITCAKYQTPVQVYSRANRNFTSSTTLAYTGLSTTCPAGKRMLVRAYFRYVNNAPLQVGAYTSSAGASAYSCMGYGDVNTGTFTLNFVITGGETIYYWAKYSGAGANRIDEEKILLG